jgi:hypothetical protein
VSMSWNKARQSVRERMAANRRRYNEAPLRDALEAQAIRALAEQRGPVLTKENFYPVTFGSVTRWVLWPDSVRTIRGLKPVADVGGPVYCRECGGDITVAEYRISFQYTWPGNEKPSTGYIHAHDCLPIIKL